MRGGRPRPPHPREKSAHEERLSRKRGICVKESLDLCHSRAGGNPVVEMSPFYYRSLLEHLELLLLDSCFRRNDRYYRGLTLNTFSYPYHLQNQLLGQPQDIRRPQNVLCPAALQTHEWASDPTRKPLLAGQSEDRPATEYAS